MKVKVTQEHIDEANMDSRGYCPISLAVSDTIGCRVVVTELDQIRIIYQKYPEDYEVYVTPTEVRDFFLKFHKKGPKAVEPFEFELKEYA